MNEETQSDPAIPANEVSTKLQSAALPGIETVALSAQSQQESAETNGRRSTAALQLPSGYEYLGELGRGGMGVVYKARQVNANRIVALKMVLTGGQASTEALARFRTEAEAAARIQHPNVVQIFEVGESAAGPFFALEYCPSGSLSNKLDGTPLPHHEAASLVAHLARAVGAAHSKGVVHRDLKPANVLLAEDGTPKIADFGLAKRLDVDSAQTRTGAVMGTPSYMAPEQASGDGKNVGPPADVWALGAILYELLTGRPPFRGTSVLQTLEQVRTREPVEVRSLNPAAPRDLETIALKCLRKEPHKRYSSARELADDLLAFLDKRPIKARPVGRIERVVKWARRRPDLASLSAALIILVVLAFVIVLDKVRELKQANADKDKALVESGQSLLHAQEEERRTAAALAAKAEALTLAQSARDGERYTSYTTLNQQANRLGADGDWGEAERLLDQCPEEYRGWEWRHLASCYKRTVIAEQMDANPKRVVFSPDGRFLAAFGGGIAIWDATTGRKIWQRDELHTLWATFAYRDDMLVVGEFDEKQGTAALSIYRASTGERMHAIPIDPSKDSWLPAPFVCRPDGLLVGIKSTGEVGTLNLSTHKETTIRVPIDRNELVVQPLQWLTPALVKNPQARAMVKQHLELFSEDYRISPDGRFVLFGEFKPVQFGQPKRILHLVSVDDSKAVCSIPFNPANRLSAVRQQFMHAAIVGMAAFSGDGKRFALWNANQDTGQGILSSYNTATGQKEQDCAGIISAGHLAVSPDSKLVAGWGNFRLSPSDFGVETAISDASTGKLLQRTAIRNCNTLVFSPVGPLLAMGNQDEVRLWDLDAGKWNGILRGKMMSPFTHVAFSPDGLRLAATTATGHVSMWDLRWQTPHMFLKYDRSVWKDVHFTHGGRQVQISTSDYAAVDGLYPTSSVRDATPGYPRKRWSADGRFELDWTANFYSMTEKSPPGGVRLWDDEKKKVAFEWKQEGQFVQSAMLSRSGERLIFHVRPTDRPVLLQMKPEEVERLDFSLIHIVDVATGRHRQLRQRCTGATVSPDGRWLAVIEHEPRNIFKNANRIWIYDLTHESLDAGREIDITEPAILHFSSKSDRLAIGSKEGSITLVAVQGDGERLTVRSSTQEILAIDFTPDQSRMVAGDHAGNVKLWETRSGREVLSLRGHEQPVWSVNFSPDGETLVSMCEDGRLNLWATHPWLPTPSFAWLDRAIAREPGNAELHFVRGFHHYRSKRWLEAVNDLAETVKRKPDDQIARLMLLEAAVEIGRWQTIVENYAWLVDKRQLTARIHHVAGNAFIRLGQFERATAAYGHDLKTRSNDPDLAFFVAASFLLAGDERGYRETIENLSQANPHPKVRSANIIARMAAMSTQPPIAEKRLLDLATEGLKDGGKGAWTTHTLGLVQLRQGHFDDAIKTFEQSLQDKRVWNGKAECTHIVNLLGLAIANQKAQRPDKAREWWNRAQDVMKQMEKISAESSDSWPMHPGDYLGFQLLLREAESEFAKK